MNDNRRAREGIAPVDCGVHEATTEAEVFDTELKRLG